MTPATESDRPEDLAELLCFGLYAANLAMGRVYAPLLGDLGLTYPQYLAMKALWHEDHRPVGDLGAALHLKSSTLTPLLKRLETQGLVTRTRDAKDERRVLIALTQEGRKLKRKAACVPPRVLEASGLSERQLLELTRKVARVREALEEAADARDG